MLKPIRRLIAAGSLLLLTGLCVALARLLPGFWFSFYTVPFEPSIIVMKINF